MKDTVNGKVCSVLFMVHLGNEKVSLAGLAVALTDIPC